MKKKQKKVLVRIILSALLLVLLNIVSVPNPVLLAFYGLNYLLIGYDILWKAIRGICHGRVLDENFLMAVATVGAIALAIYEGSTDFNEAIAVLLFYQIGELFQSYAVGKSRKNIMDLMDIRPDYANLEGESGLTKVSPEEVSVGSIIVVQPGEKVPLDGVVVEGTSTLNTGALTGESVPRDIAPGEDIISGCINQTGVLRIRTSKPFGESTVSKILQLMEESSSKKSKSENFISKFARVYTPAVCGSALALALLPPLILLIAGKDPAFSDWIYRALTFLVISCPCALVISVPLTFFAGIGGAGKAGILLKGSNYMEALSKIKILVFDKTGTLTKGVFIVNGIHHNIIEDNLLVEYAALAECASSHPISKSLRLAYEKTHPGLLLDRNRVEDIQEISGEGILAKVDGKKIAIGNPKLMDRLGVPYHNCHMTGTILHIALEGNYGGHIVISDVEKDGVVEAIQNLKKAGIRKTVMLTGDAKKVAEEVGEHLSIDEIHSELLPGDKVALVEKLLQEKQPGETLGFVGDGINDAPVLGRADVGIAMGAMGSDAAIEAADVVLMDDDPRKISEGINISKKCLRIVRENVIFALAIKGVCLILGAMGIANMWLAIFADVGVMVLAVLNAIRALQVKKA